MLRYLAFAVFLFEISEVFAGVFNGNGEILFTYHTEFFTRGSRIIYRPQKYKKFSPLGKGSVAKIAYTRVDSQADVGGKEEKEFLNDKNFWDEMSWDYAGSYYYIDTTIEDVYPEARFEYCIAIYNEKCSLIYEESMQFYEVADEIKTCTLDQDCDYYDDYTCSEALEKCGTKGDTSDHPDGGQLAGLIIISTLSVTLSVLLCILCKTKCGQRRTHQCINSLPCWENKIDSSDQMMENEKFSDLSVPSPTLNTVAFDSNLKENGCKDLSTNVSNQSFICPKPTFATLINDAKVLHHCKQLPNPPPYHHGKLNYYCEKF
ncbi:uncharacterized protein [Watersipora subatra]|uniref:uncharacterized protein n=1 Tax=Watersipora subatra TaxID=2589382 RepID=UPI00355BC29A